MAGGEGERGEGFIFQCIRVAEPWARTSPHITELDWFQKEHYPPPVGPQTNLSHPPTYPACGFQFAQRDPASPAFSQADEQQRLISDHFGTATGFTLLSFTPHQQWGLICPRAAS